MEACRLVATGLVVFFEHAHLKKNNRVFIVFVWHITKVRDWLNRFSVKKDFFCNDK